MLSGDPDGVLRRLRTLCLALPETAEKVSHGIPAFAVAGRMFAYFRHDHHGDGHTAVCVKTSGRDEQDMLIEADPDRYRWPAYIGPSGWIALTLADEDPDWTLVEDRVLNSYRLAAPPRLRDQASALARTTNASSCVRGRPKRASSSGKGRSSPVRA